MTKLNKRPSPFYFKIYFKIAIFVIVSILLLSLSLYFYTSNTIYNLEYRSNLKLFSQFSGTANQLNERIKSDLVTISSNSEFNYLLHSSDQPINKITSTLGHIKAVVNADYIQSIYLYNANTSTYYITGRQTLIRTPDNFTDREISHILNNIINYDTSQPILREIPKNYFIENEKTKVLTYVLRENYSNKFYNAVIINVNVDDFFTYICNYSNKESYDQILLLNNDGSTMGSFPSETASEKYGTEYKNKILSAGKDSSYFLSRHNGEPSVISYVHLMAPKWIFVCISPIKDINSIVNIFSISILSIVLCSLLLSLLCSYFLAKRIAMPVSYIMHKLGSLFPSKNPAFLQEDLKSISENIDIMQNTISNSIYHIKNEYLKAILRSGALKNDPSITYDFITSEDYENASFLLCLYRVGHKSTQQKFESFVSDQMFITSAKELAAVYFPCEFININAEYIAAILNISDCERVYQRAGELNKKIQNEYQKHYQSSLAVFIGTILTGIDELSSSYTELYHLSLYRIIFGSDCILNQTDFNNMHFENTIISLKELNKLSSLINLSKPEDSIAYLHELLEDLKKHSYTSLIASVNIMSTAILNTIGTVQRDERAFLEATCTSSFSKINTMESLDEIEKEFAKIIILIHNIRENSKSMLVRDNIENLITYINNNFSDVNMCADTLADTINMPTRLMRKEFYNRTSQTIQAYINHCRLKQAKLLLSDTDKPIADILTEIGWGSPKHFYTLFKQDTGLTPNEYRIQRKNSQ